MLYSNWARSQLHESNVIVMWYVNTNAIQRVHTNSAVTQRYNNYLVVVCDTLPTKDINFMLYNVPNNL